MGPRVQDFDVCFLQFDSTHNSGLLELLTKCPVVPLLHVHLGCICDLSNAASNALSHECVF